MYPGTWVHVLMLVSCLLCWPQSTRGRFSREEIKRLYSYLQTDDLELDKYHEDTHKRSKIDLELDAGTCQFRHRDQDVKNYVTSVSADLIIMSHCLATWMNQNNVAEWNYMTNLTETNTNENDYVSMRNSGLLKQCSRMARQYRDDVRYHELDWDKQRQLRLMAYETSPNKKADNKKLIELSSELESIYSKATVDGKPLDPDINTIMETSRNQSELEWAWKGWRDATGPAMKDKYKEFVHLLNTGAHDNGFDNYADAWMASQFDQTPDMWATADQLWSELKPLYEQMHAYVRHKLLEKYGGRYGIMKDGAIPAHLLGNMWAQEWQSIYDLVKPFNDVAEPDYDRTMKEKGVTVDRLFTLAEEFYVSIGLDPMTAKFNKYSMKVRPTDGRQVVCHASASDFYTDDDFRIKMCTKPDMTHFETIHHEMGHIEYFMAYRKRPTVYRDGASSAFHEAIGDTISLSVTTPAHLRAVGLGDGEAENDDEYQRNINFLMKRALFKIGFLPFGFLVDKWRWEVFRGITKETDYNKRWWELRLEYQGLVAPVPRSEADFDPGAKYHIPSNSPYICYFISYVVQFQFYEAMCTASGHEGPLFTCDFFKSKEAGGKLRSMLELGKSKPWPEAMERLTGGRHISTSSIRQYFAPLYEWLKQQNEETGTQVGWEGAQINWADDDSDK